MAGFTRILYTPLGRALGERSNRRRAGRYHPTFSVAKKIVGVSNPVSLYAEYFYHGAALR